jgi:hypothetical protein
LVESWECRDIIPGSGDWVKEVRHERKLDLKKEGSEGAMGINGEYTLLLFTTIPPPSLLSYSPLFSVRHVFLDLFHTARSTSQTSRAFQREDFFPVSLSSNIQNSSSGIFSDKFPHFWNNFPNP